MANVNFVGRIYRAYGPRGGIIMNKRNLSRRRFLELFGILLSGLCAIRWQKISHIFSRKDTPPHLKEAQYYSRGDEMAG
jgi:uncharacterized membrane protein YidH (DUF202 family)